MIFFSADVVSSLDTQVYTKYDMYVYIHTFTHTTCTLYIGTCYTKCTV